MAEKESTRRHDNLSLPDIKIFYDNEYTAVSCCHVRRRRGGSPKYLASAIVKVGYLGYELRGACWVGATTNKTCEFVVRLPSRRLFCLDIFYDVKRA